MKSVECPICGQRQYSDCFVLGEHFPCLHCRQELVVTSEDDPPTLKAAQNILDKMAWAKTLWHNGKLSLSPEKLQGLGEFIVRATDMERWTSQTGEKLQERLGEITTLRRFLAEKGVKDQFYAFYQSALEMYLQFRKENPDQ